MCPALAAAATRKTQLLRINYAIIAQYVHVENKSLSILLRPSAAALSL